MEIVTDIKKNYTEMVPLEVEVGAAGHYQHFASLGPRQEKGVNTGLM